LAAGLAGAGLPHCRFHDLRHACSGLLASLGVHEFVIMALLGHSEVQQTAGYGAPDADALRAAIDRLGAMLDASPEEGVS
jgi:integrase